MGPDMRKTTLITAVALFCWGCSPEPSTAMRPQPESSSCPSGCAPEQPPAGAPLDNPDNPPVGTPPIDAGVVMPPPAVRDCSPGLYLGTYDCQLDFFGIVSPLAGDVAFDLSINEMTIDGECETGEEFCPDLVISENGGTLFGIAAGLWGFETQLEGALDCTTGEFRATGLGGRWGAAVSTDPNDPTALWTVEDPPSGMFDGELTGTHTGSPTETIAGEWFLLEAASGITCTGPFTVTLQP
jgi:hypothetical protein